MCYSLVSTRQIRLCAQRATRHWQLTSAPGRAIGLQTIYIPLNLHFLPGVDLGIVAMGETACPNQSLIY
jgi:hypothetical protein